MSAISNKWIYAQYSILAVGAVFTLALVLTIPDLLDEKDKLEKRLATLGDEVVNLEDRKRKLEGDNKKLKDDNKKLEGEYERKLDDVAKLISEDAPSTNEIEQAREELQQKTSNLSRVYIHTLSTEQSVLANQIAKIIRSDGVLVPAEEISVAEGPDQSQVRYFVSTDAAEAGRIAKQIREALPALSINPMLIGNYNLRPGHFEIYLSADAGQSQ